MNTIETTDCFGVTVTCSVDRWETHIISGHPELLGKENIVAQTISDPKLVVYQSSDRNAYYNNDSSSIKPPFYTAVIVEYTNNSGTVTGSVKTAFIAKKLRKNDENAKTEIRRL